jgi:hypothetical protein
MPEVMQTYARPTPETDAFMEQIDDSEIDLSQVAAKLRTFECERDELRARQPISKTNQELAASILMQDPETGEELRPTGAPDTVGASLVFIVGNRDGTRKWKHTITTEEV